MKKLFLGLIVSLFLTVAHGQTAVYHPFPDSNAVWAVQWYVGGPPQGTGMEWYSIKSDDTLINSLTYKKFYFGNTFIGGIRENTATKKVYFTALSTNFPSCPGVCYNSECLLYDFSAGVGDTVFYGLGGYKDKVVSIDSIQLLDGTYRKRFKTPNSFVGIIEGIGSTENVLCGWASGMTTFDLRCFQQDTTTLYFSASPQYSSCPILTSIQEINLPISSLIISPNPFSSQTVLRAENSFHSATLTVDNCFGQTVAQIKNISGQTVTFSRDNLASGLYFYKVTGDKGQGTSEVIATGKLVITD